MRPRFGPRICITLIAMTIPLLAQAVQPEFCPTLYRKGVLNAPFNVAFLRVEEFNGKRRGSKQDGLLISSFHNVEKDWTGSRVEKQLNRDLVARIPNLDNVNFKRFNGVRHIQVLTDHDGTERQTWPNETSRVPDGVLPFEGVISPQGFQVSAGPGRLSIINLDSPDWREYIVDQSTFRPPRCEPGNPNNQPWFYHDVRFFDMNTDGKRDIVTVRSSFRVKGGICPPMGQLVWFQNPGKNISPRTEWKEHVLIDIEPAPGGPEINLDMHDFEGDGVPEIIATHFFKYDAMTIYGAPKGMRWRDVSERNPVRQNDIMRGQGNPFAVEIVDLNQDGKMDILTSNHQGDQCYEVTKTDVSGRVLAIEQPLNGDLFEGEWQTRVLLDNIRATPTVPEPVRGPGRLAPNHALVFWPKRAHEEEGRKPWIVVGGDEAAKVWMLKPRGPEISNWVYEPAVVFDINDYYGANTTQTLQEKPRGITISTIGGLDWRYDKSGPDGRAEFYIPVFEARDIHVLSFRKSDKDDEPTGCVKDVYPACPRGDAATSPAVADGPMVSAPPMFGGDSAERSFQAKQRRRLN